jgi:NADPH:quinone reductase
VVATGGSRKRAEKVMALGADHVVLRGADDFKGALLEKTGRSGFDAVLDSASGELFGTHLSVLRKDGALITCGAHAKEKVELDVVELFQNGWRVVGFRIAPPDELRAAVDLIRNGVVRVPVDTTFPMSQAAQAHRYLDQQRHVGKVLLVAD